MPRTAKTPVKKKRVRPNFYTSELSSEEHESEAFVIEPDESAKDTVKPVVEVVSETTSEEVTETPIDKEPVSSKEARDDKEFWKDDEQKTEGEPTPSTPPAPPNEPLLDVDTPSTPRGRRNLLWILVFIALVAGAVGAGTFIYLDKFQKAQPTPTPQPEETAAPTAVPSVDISQYTIRVLNGSGKTGAAGQLKTMLEKDGFTVKDATNADKSDYAKTVIKAKASVPAEYISKLQDELSKVYTLGDNQTLEDSAKTDLVVIIGKAKAGQ